MCMCVPMPEDARVVISPRSWSHSIAEIGADLNHDLNHRAISLAPILSYCYCNK